MYVSYRNFGERIIGLHPVTYISRAFHGFDSRHPGVGFWVKDNRDNPFFVIHEFVGGQFVRDPAVVERMTEFCNIDWRCAYLLEIDSVSGERKALYKLQEVAMHTLQGGIEARQLVGDWRSLEFMMLKFLIKSNNALSFVVPDIPSSV